MAAHRSPTSPLRAPNHSISTSRRSANSITRSSRVSTQFEAELFIGPPEAQADPSALDFGGSMQSVTDRASACAAIEMIVEQGEAPSQSHPDAHFCVFDRIRLDFEAAVATARDEGRTFDAVRAVTPNSMTRFYDDTSGGTVIAHPDTPSPISSTSPMTRCS